MAITIGQNKEEHIPRVAQLTQKTNQFNLTTYRYTESQIRQFLDQQDSSIFTIFVRDKFGDSGLTGVGIIKADPEHPGTAVIDSLLMSCRIIGRNIEYVFLNKIIQSIKEKGFNTITASYIPTKKNAQVASFYEKLGFSITDEKEGAKHYELSV